MYNALFRIQSPSTIHYEKILKDDIAHLPGVRKIGINPLSHTFLVAYEIESFDAPRLLQLFEEKGIFCSLEWVIEDVFFGNTKSGLMKLRLTGCRLLSLFGASLVQFCFWKSSESFSLILACLGFGDFYWTVYQIRSSGYLPTIIESQVKWLSIHTALCVFLKIMGESGFPNLILFHLILAVFSASILLHTDIVSKLTHQQDLDYLWTNIKASRNGSHDFIDMPIDTLIGGEFVLVQIGELFPTDGTITSGATLVDDSWLDGKTHSCAKYEGEQVISGSRNLTAPVMILTICSRKLSLFNRIHENLLTIRCKRERLHSFTFFIVPFLLAVLCLHFLEQSLTGVLQLSTHALALTMKKIIYGCPFLGFLGLALTDALTRRQILEEHPEIYIPQLFLFSKPIRHVLFKKEFLTRKRHVLNDIITFPSAISIELNFHSSFSKGAVLLIASSIQRHANIELSQALLDVYIPNSTQKNPKEAIEIVSSMLSFSNIELGKGIETCFRGSNILMGLPDWVSQKGKVDLSIIRDWIDICLIKGEHVEVMSLEGAIIAAFSFSEQSLPNTISILQSIQQANCQPILYTENKHEPFLEEIRNLVNLEVMRPVEALDILNRSGRQIACIEGTLSTMTSKKSLHIEICTLKERSGESIPIQIVPKQEEHVGTALLLINEYIRIRNFNVLLSYLWSALTINIQVIFSSPWTEPVLILLQLYGALIIVLHATQCLSMRSLKK